MGTKIQIICARPGMLRHGVAHPANATYDIGRWTEEQLAVFREDPSFHVNEIDDAGVVTRGDEFDKTVAETVDQRVKAIGDQMTARFNDAVNAAAAEKAVEAETKASALEHQLSLALAKAKDQQAEIEGLKARIAELLAAAKAKPAKT